MLAKDIMTTQVLTVYPTSTIKEAMRLLVEIEISGLIVTNENNEIIGVVSGKDLLFAYDQLGQLKASIENFVNKNVISVEENTPLEDIRKILIEKNILRVPVLRDKKVVGVVSRRDVLKSILKEAKNI